MLRKLVWFPLTVLFAYFAMTDIVFAASTPAAPDIAAVAASRIPLYFESNQGQTAGEVCFLARAGGYTAFLTGQETVLQYHSRMPGHKDGGDAVVRMRLAGSREASVVAGGERLPGMVNYLIGDDPSRWHTRIPTYADVDRAQVYPGVDLTYRADGKQLEFDFHVAPGATPDPIRMTYAGTSGMRLNVAGDLILDTTAGPVSILKPFAYQQVESKPVPIAVTYALLPGGEVGFQVGKYDRSRVLVIDPTVGPSVDYSTYLGSGSGDTFASIAVDAAGEAFITGSTPWNNYPTGALPGYSPYSSTFPQIYYDDEITAGFVTALNATGTGIIYSTYIAGNSASSNIGVALNGIAVDATGFAFAVGQTDDSTFPKVKAFQSAIPSSRSGYGVALGVVFELSQHGDSLIYSSFLGGGDYDTISAVAVDSSDNAYVTGTNTVQGSSLTSSGFPVTSGVIWGHFTQQNIGAGFNDAFAAKITPPTSANAVLAYSTVIGSGGSNTPFTYGSVIAVDSSGDAYIAGSANCNIGDHGGTITTNLNMTHVTRAQSEYVNNVWVLKLNPAATAATYIAYLGGSAPGGTYSPDTSVAGIKVDSSGLAYVAGTTEANNFQTTETAYQPTKQLAGVSNSGTEQSDGFVTVIAAGGASFTYSTYLNGTTVSAAAIADSTYGSPTISGIALGTGGQFAVSGLATTTNFPRSGSPAGTPLLSAFPGCPGNCAAAAAFITKFTTSGLVYSTFLGAGNEAGVNGIASNGTDVYVLLGEPANALNSCGAYDTDNSSGFKELVVRVLDAPAIATTVSVDSKTADVSSSPQTISLTSSISASSTVNGGTATYAVTNSSAAQIGSAVTSEIVANGLSPSLSFTLPANTPIGSYTITEHYCGAEGFLNSSATGSLVVSSPAPATTTAVTSSLNPSVYGQSVTFTATVSSASTAPAGSVQFAVDGTNLGAAVALTAASGTSKTATSQATTTLPAAGSPHTVLASYLNTDGNFSDSSGTLSSGQTVTLATQATLTVTGVPNVAQGYGASFTVGSSGGSGTGAVTYAATGSCSVSGTTVTITSSNGTCSVTATKATDGDYSSAASAAVSVSAMPATQATLTVTGVPMTARAYAATFTVGSSGGSGTGAVTYGTTGSCSVSGTTVTMTSGSGTCSVTATKAADANYLSASSAASSVSAALATQATLTLTGVPMTAQTYAATFTVGSSGGSGTGSVTYAATGSCSVSGTTVTMTSGTGTCSVTASRAADGNYLSASSAAGTVSAALATQATLTVTGVPNTTQAYGAAFTVSSSGGSGTGSVTYAATGSCAVSGTTVTVTSSTGTCSVTATRATDGNYASATSAAASVSAGLATQATLTVTGVPNTAQAYGATFTVGSSGGSGTGAVTYTVTGSCSISGTTVTVTSGSGTCSVTATKATDGNYLSASSAAATVSAALATQATLTLTGVPMTARAYGATFTVGSSGGSGSGSVTYATTGSCSVSGTTVTMTSGTGTCSVTATRAADGNYLSASSPAASVSAALATQATLTLTGVPNTTQAYGATFTVSSSGGSGTSAVTYTATGSCSVSGTTVTVTSGSGTCSVTATKATDGNYLSASSAAGTVSAALATQATLTVTGVPNTTQAYGTTFTVGSSGGAGTGSVTFAATGSCSVSGTTVTVTSGSGTCSVTASRAADGNYAGTTSAAATVTVSRAAAPVSVWPAASSITYGQTLASSILTGGAASVAGSFAFTTPGTAPGAGTASQGVTFTPANSEDYTPATGTVSVTVNKVTPAVSVWPAASSITYGQTLASSLLTGGTASVSGTFSWSTPAITPGVGTAAESVTFTPTDATDYNTVTGSVSVTGNKATATVTLGNLTQPYSGSALTVTAITAPANLAVTFAYTENGQPVTSPASVGAYAVTATINSSNYSGTTTGTLTISQATQTITFTPPVSPVFYGVAPITLAATGGASGNAVTFSVVSGPGLVSDNTLTITGAGTVVVAANQAGNGNYAAAAQVVHSIVAAAVSLNFNVAALDFSSVPLGSISPDQTLILTNPNGEPVTVNSIQASGDFSATDHCPIIAPLATCSVNITFTPTASGARSGTLTVTEAQSNNPQSIPLTGMGTAPGILVTPALLIFGSQVVSTTSVGQAVTIMNTGTAALTISTIATSGDFATSGTCATIPAGSNCSLTVTFTPTTTGTRAGTVTLTGNAGGDTQSQVVNLSAMGTQAGATLTPSVQLFPGTLVGSSSFVLNATLTNSGSAPLSGIGVSILGDFTETNTCTSTLAPAATCIINVTYTPTVAGAESGNLTITNNLGTQTVSLAGTGLAPGASLNTAQLVYGGQLVGTSSLAQSVIFSNTGNAAVNITSAVPSSNFTDTTNCSGTIAAGATCSVNVIFTPTATGPLSGTMTIIDSAGTQVLTMQGQGVSPGLAVSPSFVIFGEQEVDTTSQAQTMTVTNTSTAPLTLNPITVSNNFEQTNQCPAILPAGAGCAISVSLSPTAVGMLSGSLVISDASGLASTLATVSGQGTLPGITPSPATLSFGSLPVGTASQAQTVTVTNSGTAPLQIGTVSGSGDFGETDTCSGQSVAAGSYCVISVTMTPSTLGPRTGVIQFNDNADGVHQIALSGMGQQAGVNISPTSLAFGSLPFVSPAQASSATGTSLSVTLSNTGGAALQLGGFRTQGDFTESDSCGATIAAGATCTLTIQFVPTAPGQRTGTLTITDPAGAGTQSVSLLGYGSPGGLTLSPPVLNFGVTTRGHTSAAQIATLTNNSGQAITGLTISASGEYSESDNCGTALASGASCTLNITVTPQTVGAITGAINISSGGSVASQAQKARIRGEDAGSSASGNVGVVAVLAYTTSQANAASQLAFGTPPAPTVTAGGNAGSYVTVQEDGSNGSLVNATDTITISVTGPGGYSNAYTATASGGVATFDLSSHALTAAGGYTYTATVASNPSIRAAVGSVTVTGGGARVSATAGGGQTAVIDQAFATRLQVLVTDTQNNPLSGTTVTYTAPATGASVHLSSGSAITGSDGTASVSTTANGNAGSYTVTAAVAGAAAASFSLTNAKATPALSWATPAAMPHGAALSSTQLDATAGGIPGSFVYIPAAGTVLSAGQQTLSVTFTPTDAADYNPASGTVVLRVKQIASTVSVASSSRESLLQNAVTFTATASAPAGTPSGTVNFLDGASVLGSGTLAAGTATFTTSSLAAGSHTIMAVYSGDTNDAGATSATLAQLVIDFAVTAGSGGSGGVQSVLPGGSATYTIAIAPTSVTAFPVPATLTVTGLPAGATAALSTSPSPVWARLTGTSWQLPANTVLSAVSLTFDIPLQTASGRGGDTPPGGPLLLGVLLLPLAGKLRRCGKRMSRTVLMLWLLAAGVAATTGLGGCASGNGFFGQAQKTYIVTVTVTAGTLSHSTNLTLMVQ